MQWFQSICHLQRTFNLKYHLYYSSSHLSNYLTAAVGSAVWRIGASLRSREIYDLITDALNKKTTGPMSIRSYNISDRDVVQSTGADVENCLALYK
jgi:hypothetical protein